jgi:prepilin signal peptidase PulO-like enzyme (type II secretory pathway)
MPKMRQRHFTCTDRLSDLSTQRRSRSVQEKDRLLVGLGLGDCTLAAGLGAFLGPEKLLWCVMTACLLVITFVSLNAFLGGVFSKREKRIPFVPFLCLSGLLFLIYMYMAI